MIASPKTGQRCRIHYRKSCQSLPHHGSTAVVVTPSQGKPRNHLVRLECGRLVVVPCGNLMPDTQTETISAAQ
jgi:hypothetical protein